MFDRGILLAVLYIVFAGQVQRVLGYYDYDYNNDYSGDGSVYISSPEECARECVDGQPPRYCYYHITLQYYTTMGGACDLCAPNITNQLTTRPQCECIYADGFEKTVLVLNRMLPGPSIQVCKDDRLIIDVQNDADGLELTLHWHGLHQRNSQYFDGVPYVTQCPILSGTTFRYQFIAANSGTHFYHSHVSTQMIDGEYGSLIVRDPPSQDPHYNLFDYDLLQHVILISDIMHEMSFERYPGRFRNNPGQMPDNILINGKGTWTDPRTNRTTNVPLEILTVRQGKRHRMRIINSFSTVCAVRVSIQAHYFQVIATDGENVKPTLVSDIIMSTGERVDIILYANQKVANYWIYVRGLGECEDNRVYQNAILRYVGANTSNITRRPPYEGVQAIRTLNSMDATRCTNLKPAADDVCYNQMEFQTAVPPELMKVEPDYRLIIPLSFFSYNNSLQTLFAPGSERKFFVSPFREHILSMLGNVSFESPQAPLLSQTEGYEQICPTSTEPSYCTQPCTCTHVYNIPYGAVTELIIWDPDCVPGLAHPFHLHGFSFHVFSIAQPGCNITENDVFRGIHQHIYRLKYGQYSGPAAKDTVVVPAGGFVIVRFKADNPGWWLFHCHFTWHTVTGMDLVFHVGKDENLPPIPRGFPRCSSWLPDIYLH